MRRNRFFAITLLSVLCIVAVSCKKEEILTFGGEMDKFTATDADGQKTYLGHAEEWIYWEADDEIKITDGSKSAVCKLISGAGTLDAFFRSETEMPTGSTIWAIYPKESFGTSYNDLIFPAEQPYRENENATHPDSSFGRGALPMVAYDAEGMAQHGKIYFHVVAGILRVQILSSETKTIDRIKFTEVGKDRNLYPTNKQISGHFTVNDINQNMPYLTSTSSDEADRTITITGINQEVGPNKLLTFYLPLPAVDGPNEYNHYVLRMTIKSSDNKYFTRDFKADIHRRNITMMRAIEATEWLESETESDCRIHLVGSGTKDRPFQIYTGGELEQLRNIYNRHYNGETVYINGQTIKGYTPSSKEEATYIKIVRSDIELLNSTDYAALPDSEKGPNSRFADWTEGIKGFKGYMYFASSTATNGGITNRSDKPLFESIATDGVVERVYVKSKQRGAATDEASTPTVALSFSPMCNVNNGTMIECHNKCKVNISENVHLAGLCVTNNGKIIGGANEAQLTTGGNVAGICYTNNGEIQGNFTLSLAVPQGQNIAGIAFNNNGQVKDCQVSSSINVNSTGNWGLVVFNNNSGAVIDNCTSTGSIVYTINGSVGGICNVNSGTVKNCTNNVEIHGATGNVGGIVATMADASADVYNCCNRALFLYGSVDVAGVATVATNCGGVVGQLVKGKVYNCYNASTVLGATNSGGMLGNMADDSEADVQNCWSAQGKGFVGRYEGAAKVGNFCFSASTYIYTSFCNHIYNAATAPTPEDAYTIIDMKSEQVLGTVVPDPTELVGEHCGEALNRWVQWRAAEGDPRVYYTWTKPAGARPVFNTGMPGGGKGRRK